MLRLMNGPTGERRVLCVVRVVFLVVLAAVAVPMGLLLLALAFFIWSTGVIGPPELYELPPGFKGWIVVRYSD